MTTTLIIVAILALNKILVPMDKWHWDSWKERRAFETKYLIGLVMTFVAIVIGIAINSFCKPLDQVVPAKYLPGVIQQLEKNRIEKDRLRLQYPQ
jgi:hypothetical protein